ncbi:Uncharacterized protein PBTT_08502 [Plasmodiophora brassicae]|uniref:Uncharacterized protein n=1 Tax=Plasmodiophora brassicae TaxID=37360 RepID=A0A0G4IL46_PLABS|nr:hypothetical protein PBRA_004533 [Plasmodiophora brassicae]
MSKKAVASGEAVAPDVVVGEAPAGSGATPAETGLAQAESEKSAFEVGRVLRARYLSRMSDPGSSGSSSVLDQGVAENGETIQDIIDHFSRSRRHMQP